MVPPGLLRNWQTEFSRWAPSLLVHTHHGPKREMLSQDMASAAWRRVLPTTPLGWFIELI